MHTETTEPDNPKVSIQNLKVYVICLDSEVERRALITKNLKALGMTAEFIGVDGNHLPEKFSDKYSETETKKFWGRGLTRGEIGTYASHYSLWEKVIENQDDHALILESDAVIKPDALQIIENIMQRAVAYDMIMLSWGDCVPSLWGRKSVNAEYSLVRFARKSFFASAYLLNPTGASKLIDNSRAFKMPVDELMLGEVIDKGMNIFAIYPRLVYLMDNAYETSTLNDDRKQISSDRGQAEKPKKRGLKKLEQSMRHLILRLRPPPAL